MEILKFKGYHKQLVHTISKQGRDTLKGFVEKNTAIKDNEKWNLLLSFIKTIKNKTNMKWKGKKFDQDMRKKQNVKK